MSDIRDDIGKLQSAGYSKSDIEKIALGAIAREALALGRKYAPKILGGLKRYGAKLRRRAKAFRRMPRKKKFWYGAAKVGEAAAIGELGAIGLKGLRRKKKSAYESLEGISVNLASGLRRKRMKGRKRK